MKAENPPYKIGLALSGGGARGFAHVGAIRALRECGLMPDIVAGVSAGAVIATLYSAGLKEREVLKIFDKAKFSTFTEFVVPRKGFFRMDKFARIVQRATGVTQIEHLPIPTLICATELDTGRQRTFSTGELMPRLMASCSIPIVFEPVAIDEHLYVDGGVLHNLPSEPLRSLCEFVIGVNCSPKPLHTKHTNSIVDVARSSFSLMAKANLGADLALCDLAVEVNEVADHRVFGLHDLQRLVDNGYHATMRAISRAEIPQHLLRLK
jgi:NTE family protein